MASVNTAVEVPMVTSSEIEKSDVVAFDYAEILGDFTPEIAKKIEAAYGYDGLGILIVKNVPGYLEKRNACVPYAYKFGNLPEETKQKYEHAASTYSFGWSHGKEKVEGKPDSAKGSYYFNPSYDRPVEDEKTIEEYASFVHPNIWPEESDCPGMKDALKACGQQIVDVGIQLSRHCDKYIRSVLPTFPENRIGDIIDQSKCTKARLLYYFPVPTTPEGSDPADMSSWCGWHNDHGSLTGLTTAMYFDSEGRQIPCPDPNAGLYIRARSGKTVRVNVPADCIAYQIGETSQVHSGGVLQATPHCVRAAEVAGVSRGTLAVFMEPMWPELMNVPPGAEEEKVLRGARGELLPPGVPALVKRWTGDEQTFGDFTKLTLASYY